MPVSFYWHAPDTADIYINGRLIKIFNPYYETRRYEAPLESFELDGTIKSGDIITDLKAIYSPDSDEKTAHFYYKDLLSDFMGSSPVDTDKRNFRTSRKNVAISSPR